MLTTQTSIKPQTPTSDNSTAIPPSPTQETKCFAIRSRNVMLPDHNAPVEAIILIQDEKILEVVLPSQLDTASLAKIQDEWIIKDYGDLFIFPGLIDSNVYLHANFGTEWDNVTYSTELAAAGGVTTIIDNPVMTRPYNSGEDYVKSLQERIKLIKEGSKVDFGIYGILEPRTEGYIDQILKAGVLGLKCYMMNPFQNTLGHYQSEMFKGILDFLDDNYPGLLLLVHPEIATERELYLTSPCRTVDPELRIHKAHQIKSIEFGGGANKGSYVEDLEKKNGNGHESDDDDDDQPTINYNSPSKLKGRIKKLKESMETNDIVHSELVSYSFENNEKQGHEDSDGSNSDVEVMALDKDFVNSHTLPAGIKPSGMQEIQMFQKNKEERKQQDDDLDKNNASPVKRGLFANLEIIKPEEIKMGETRLKIQNMDNRENENKENNIHIESFEIRGLSEIPEELDREERPSVEPRAERNLSLQIMDSTTTETQQEVQEEIVVVSRPKRHGRSRFTTIDEGNEEENDRVANFQSEIKPEKEKEREISINTFEFPVRTGPRHYSEDLCKRSTQDDLSNRRIINPELVSLMATNPKIQITREDSFLGDNTEEDHKSKCVSLDTNLLLDQSPIGADDSPLVIHPRSLNISPVFARKASTPVGSGLLQRRLDSRKSSAGVPGDSTTSSLSSPTADFKRLNTLNISRVSKGSNNNNESKYNQSYRVFLANRPQSWEENAVSLVIGAMRKETTVRIMFQNLSLASSFLKIRQKKKADEAFSDKILGDCSPSYMFFHEKMVKKGETKYKASPPFRNRENKKLIVETLRLGGVNVMSSYHFFVPARFKLVDDGNFRRAFSGLDCLGCSLQAAWTTSYSYQRKNNKRFLEDLEHQKEVINQILRRIYEAMCLNPAKILKIASKKGTIAKGMDADFVVWDPFSINNNNDLNPNHIFSGKKLLGVVQKTYLRGNLIYSKDDAEEISREYVPKFIRT